MHLVNLPNSKVTINLDQVVHIDHDAGDETILITAVSTADPYNPNQSVPEMVFVSDPDDRRLLLMHCNVWQKMSGGSIFVKELE